MTYPVDRLLASLEQIRDLSEPAVHEVHGGYRQSKRIEPFGWVLMDYAPVKTAWLSWIEPGGYVKPHRDAAPWYERWQIPVITAGRMTINGVDVDQQPGVPFQVEHWLTHEVVNDTDHPRVHLVLDRKIIAHEGTAGFVLG